MTDRAARLGDRVNPIVVKETRQAVNSRLVAGTLLLFLGIQLLAITLMITTRDTAGGPTDEDLRAGRQVFTFIQGILLGTCMLLIPTLTGVRLAAERSDVNVDLLFITSLSPRAIMAGKLFTAAATALLIFSACAPFMTFAYVLRGLDMPTIVIVLAADFLAVLVGTMYALLLAAIPATRGLRIVLGLGGFIGLCYLFGGTLALSTGFLEYGGGFDTTGRDFWLGFAGAAAAVLGFTGLMFVWATALITPPTANRGLVVRAYTLGLWAAGGVGCAVWSWYVAEPGPVYVWGAVGTLLFLHQLLVAVSERDSWGPRVLRRIPRRLVLRVPAFVLYSGAAGGILFAATGAGLTAVGMWAWHEVSPGVRRPSDWWEPAQVAALASAYAYCYCLTAVLVRRLLRNTAYKPIATWLVALILFGLGCIIPYITAYALFPSRSRYGYADDTIWLYLPNPVVMIEDSTHRTTSHTALTVVFVTVWAIGVTLLNVPWFVRQAVAFRPPDRVEVLDAEPVEAEATT